MLMYIRQNQCVKPLTLTYTHTPHQLLQTKPIILTLTVTENEILDETQQQKTISRRSLIL